MEFLQIYSDYILPWQSNLTKWTIDTTLRKISRFLIPLPADSSRGDIVILQWASPLPHNPLGKPEFEPALMFMHIYAYRFLYLSFISPC